MGMNPGLGFAQDPSQYAGNLDYSGFPAPPGFSFGNDPYSQQMVAAQNQAAAQYGYLGQVYGPYLQGMLNQGAQFAPGAGTPKFDKEMKGLAHTGKSVNPKEAAAGMAVLDAQTRAGHISAGGLADAGSIYQAAQPGIADAQLAQQQNALYGQFSQNATAIAGQQAGGNQDAISNAMNAIGSAAQAGQPMSPDMIASIGQLYNLSPDEVTSLQSYASSVAASNPGIAGTYSLGQLNPAWSTVDQKMQTYVQTSKGKTLADVQADVLAQLAAGADAYILANPQVKQVILHEIEAIWHAQQATIQQTPDQPGMAQAGSAGAMQVAPFGQAPQTSFAAPPPTNFGGGSGGGFG